MKKPECDKIRHQSYQAAITGIKIANRAFTRGNNKHAVLKNAYKCHICGYWHTTKNKPKKKNGR